MNKTELIAKVAEKGDMTKVAAGAAVEALLDTLSETLIKEDISLVGFGSFKRTTRAARKGRNPATGAVIDIPASNSIKFAACKQLKDSIAPIAA